jgi:hypothetical protein
VSARDLAVVADDRWGTPCLGYLAQARIADPSLAAMATIQSALRAIVPLPLHLCPVRSLHVTIYGFVLPRWPDAGKDAHWQAIGAPCLAALDALGAGQRGVALQFDRLSVTPMAVIATATDPSGLIGRLRAAFAGLARHPVQPAPRYDIIHMTLARFGGAGVVSPTLLRDVAAIAPCGAAPVTQLQIVRERVYPSLEVDTLATVPLAP